MPAILESKQTKYRDIAEALRRQIHSDQLAAGERMPSFDEVCEIYGVTPNTVVRVYGLLEQEGLVERQRGRGIFVAERKRKLTGNIGIIGSKSFHQQHTNYYSRLMQGMEKAARQSRQHLLSLGTDLDWEPASLEKVDGVLVTGIDQVETLIKEIPDGTPAVAVLIAAQNVPSITADDYQGARLAVQYLLDHHHRRIACLMEETPILSRRRLAGYQDAMLAAGIKIDPKWMRLVNHSESLEEISQLYVNWGRTQMRQWLQHGWNKANCTAIFVQNETAAIGVMQVLQEEGIKVPEQVSIIGFDGTDLCNYVSPSLCAVQVPLMEVGTKAVELLNQQIQGTVQTAHSIVIPPKINGGSSVTFAP
jgi:DNA-binding LacI/PurR family transcriptional regulator